MTGQDLVILLASLAGGAGGIASGVRANRDSHRQREAAMSNPPLPHSLIVAMEARRAAELDVIRRDLAAARTAGWQHASAKQDTPEVALMHAHIAANRPAFEAARDTHNLAKLRAEADAAERARDAAARKKVLEWARAIALVLFLVGVLAGSPVAWIMAMLLILSYAAPRVVRKVKQDRLLHGTSVKGDFRSGLQAAQNAVGDDEWWNKHVTEPLRPLTESD